MSQPTLREVMAAATRRLAAAGVPDPARDVRRLMRQAVEYVHPKEDMPIPAGVARRFESMIAAREKRMPVSHIVGYREFWGRKFIVGSDVLDPRPETECLIEIALQERFERVVDLGTGSGAILWTLLGERPAAHGVGADLSPEALEIAKENPLLDDYTARAHLVLSDWWDQVEGKFDLVVSNPPYIAQAEMADLAPEVRDHEPAMALTDGADGLGAYRAIAAGLNDHLQPGGRLLVEIGPSQAAAVRAIFSAAGLAELTTHPDLDGRDRVISGRKPRN